MLALPHMGEYWLVQFNGRAGASARAAFASEQEARDFVTRHAAAINQAGVPLQWNDTGEAKIVTTPLGRYWLVRMDDDRQGAAPSGAGDRQT